MECRGTDRNNFGWCDPNRIRAYITSKIGLCSPENVDFSPFEIKKVCVSANLNGFNRELFEENKCHKTVEPSLYLKNSPFIVFSEEGNADGSLFIQNRSPVPVTLPEGIELANADVDLTSYKVAGPEAQKNYRLEIVPNEEAILSTDELENLLEPGMSPPIL